MRHDYKNFSTQEINSPGKFRPEKAHLLLITAIAVGLTIGFSLMPNQAGANKKDTITEKQSNIESSLQPAKTQRIIESLSLPDEPQVNSLQLPLTRSADSAEDTSLNWKTVKVKSGDTMAQIFSRLGISASVLHQVINTDKSARKLANIRPGQNIRFQLDEQGALHQLVYQYDIANSLQIKKNSSGFDAETLTKSLDKRIAHSSANITHSLFLAGQSAGLSDNMTMHLANIFGWDIDFALDMRKGDHFTVIYEEIFLDDKKIRDGNILAAEFHNRGKTYRAIRYEDKNGQARYYSPDGMSMRKAFLRSPVEFSRISSRFSLGRKHPILNKIRAHKGVDYAASRGTPIKATGDGKIVFKGNKGGYGKTIIIKHGSAYSTLYAHMRSYNKRSRIGSRVKQGQVIGYIGSTGLATGPHLHFEFRVNGVHRNPLTVRLPKASPLPKKYRADFKTKAKSLVTQLDLIKTNTLASLQ